MFRRHALQLGPSRSQTRKPVSMWAEPWMKWRENGWRELICPACHELHLMPKRLDASPPFEPRERYSLYQCEACGTLHYPDAEVFEYESRKDADLARKFYLEVGAGLDSMIAPLAWAGMDDIDSLLEVGGGYGFSVDFASRELGWSAANIDPSFLARTGARDLGHTHVAAYLSPGHRLADQSFDLVLSSEVIEHVKDPDPFITSLTAALSPDGVLLLTTPNAAVVHEEASEEDLLPVITAGHHVVIFSKQGLKSVLARAGYSHIVVEENGMTLLAAASRRPIDVDFNARPDRSRLQSYLAGRMDALGADHSLFAAFAVRLMKEYVHTGQWDRAEEICTRIKQRWLADYGFSLDVPGSLNPAFVRHGKNERRRLREFAAQQPFSLTSALYFSACIDREAGRTRKAIEGFEAAARVSETMQKVFASMYASCRETEDLGLRGRLSAAELGASRRPGRSARMMLKVLGIITPALREEWYRIACHVFAAGALTGRNDEVAVLLPFVRGHLDEQLASEQDFSAVEGYAAAGIAGLYAEAGKSQDAAKWYTLAAGAMTDPAENAIFVGRANAMAAPSGNPGQRFIESLNSEDVETARSLVGTVKAGPVETPSIAFALGIYHLNIEPDATEAMRWFAAAREFASGDERINAELHLAIAAERLPEARRRNTLPALLGQLQKTHPSDPDLGSRIKDLAARYNAGAGTKEALS
ncbi:class I SAM-dependent methyltransferase [Hyphobacterium sp. HN65]|uniref:Class I SAM-dependent methyltransferase n=1 Tax=Hyphobacterium lacteum TaxID=3116575 RepID=A0ABU7LNQ9_9PROT|nr:class I SAM-dependent methyltransferase [Hyphobacterium sp. HN65]MEE2525558.1 class I SAM-dependent methyltransferase [Hyphobacterium sp. HN65]